VSLSPVVGLNQADGLSAPGVLLGGSQLNEIAPSLVLQFSGASALDSRITFTRASTAVVTASNGLLQTVPVDSPRFEYDPTTLVAKGLLIEEARTNLLRWSDDIGNVGAWNPGSSPTRVANANIAPDGTQTAPTITVGGGFDGYYQGLTVALATTYACSVWVKNVSGCTAANLSYDGGDGNSIVTVNPAAGTVTSSGSRVSGARMVAYPNGWYRVEWLTTFSTTNAALICYAGTATSMSAWGYQVEQAATVSSRISTTTATVTRSADICSIPVSSAWFSQTGSTWVAAAKRSTSAQVTTECVIGYSNALDPTPISLQNNGGTNFSLSCWTGSSGLATSNFAANGTRFKGALAHSSLGRALALNGGTVATDGSIMPNPTTIHIGQDNDGQYWLNGTIESILYYPVRLPNATVVALAT